MLMSHTLFAVLARRVAMDNGWSTKIKVFWPHTEGSTYLFLRKAVSAAPILLGNAYVDTIVRQCLNCSARFRGRSSLAVKIASGNNATEKGGRRACS